MKIVYIVGCGHSGSTLLDRFLCGHHDVTAVGELVSLPGEVALDRHCGCGEKLVDCSLWRSVLETAGDPTLASVPYSFEHLKSSDGFFERMGRFAIALAGRPAIGLDLLSSRERRSRSVVANLLGIYRSILDYSGRGVVVDSSKSVLTMKWLWMLHPDTVKILYIVRDGRGVARSAVRKGKDFRTGAESWKKGNSYIRSVLRGISKSAWQMVRYEELTARPEEIGTQLCEFIGLDYDENMPEIGKASKCIVGANRMARAQGQKIRPARDCRASLSQEEEDAFQEIAGTMSRALGYS